MEDDSEGKSSKKRPRIGDTVEELRRAIKEKDSENEFMKQKFEFIMKENEKLRKNIESLLDKIQRNEADRSLQSEADMSEGESQSELSEGIKSDIEGTVTPKKGIVKKARKRTLFEESKDVTKKENRGATARKPTIQNATASVEKKKSGTVPVLTTYNVNIKTIIGNIDAKLGHKNYTIKILGNNVANIGVCTLGDFDMVKALLEEQKVNYYTYTPKGLRPFTVVAEGLPHSFESGEILEYLSSLQININIISLAKLGNDKWVIRLSRDSDISKFYDIRYILRCRVRIRKYIMKGVTQCYNCQRFGHVSSNCRMPYRCVKCGGSHGPGKCSIPPKGENNMETLTTDPVTGQVNKRVGLPVKCINCGVEGHAASSKDCPRRIELMHKLEAKKTSMLTPATRAVPAKPTFVNAVSYAAAAKSSLGREQSFCASRNPSKAPLSSSSTGISLAAAVGQYDAIDRDCKRLLGGGLMQCLSRLGDFANEYRQLVNDDEKSRALLGMLLTLGRNG